MTNIISQKRMAAEIMKCGTSRVKITTNKEVEEALTREDVRNLIRKGFIKKIQKRGSSRAAARKTLAQKKKGRRKGMGSRKGSKRARISRKEQWMRNVKIMRKLIKELRDTGRIERRDYRRLYLRVKGGMFRNRKHIMLYLKEHELLKVTSKPAVKKSKPKTKPAKPAAKPTAKKPTTKKPHKPKATKTTKPKHAKATAPKKKATKKTAKAGKKTKRGKK